MAVGGRRSVAAHGKRNARDGLVSAPVQCSTDGASAMSGISSGAPGLAWCATIRQPWLVAFAFGLLHGFGFAGALSEVGLPRHDIPLALLLFNLGVEAGQLLFIAALLAVRAAFLRLAPRMPLTLARLPTYGIGAAAAFWLIQRMAVIL